MSILLKFKKQIKWLSKNKVTDKHLKAFRETSENDNIKMYLRDKYGCPAAELRREREFDKQLNK